MSTELANKHSSSENDISNSVSFGRAPESIILKFIRLCEKHTSLSECLKHLLTRESKRFIKYQFEPLTDSARDWHVIVSPEEDMVTLERALQDLDDYVYRNRLKDRASGIEELLLGTPDEEVKEEEDRGVIERNKELSVVNDFINSDDHSKVIVIHTQEAEEMSEESETSGVENNDERYCKPANSSIDFLKGISSCPLNVDNKIVVNLIKDNEAPDLRQEEIEMEPEENVESSEESPAKDAKYQKPKGRGKAKMKIRVKKLHSSDLLPCPICGERYNGKVSLQLHSRQVHRRHITVDNSGNVELVNRELLQCDLCDYVALRGGRLSTHRKKVHGVIDEIQCSICNKVFNSYRSHNHHYHQFHTLLDVACDVCGKICRNRASFYRHYSSHVQEFQCSMCDKIFKDRRSYLQHEKRHRSDAVYPCEHCGKVFNQKANMERHVKVLHLKMGKLICDFCTYTTFYSAALKEHVDRVHHGIKKVNFTCEHCGKTFLRKHTYEEHVDRHEGRYRYSCEVCGKKYRNKSGCKKHSAQCNGTKALSRPGAKGSYEKGKIKVEKESIEEEITLETIETTHDQMDIVYTLTETLVESTPEERIE